MQFLPSAFAGPLAFAGGERSLQDHPERASDAAA
jgi:hypothetical protein